MRIASRLALCLLSLLLIAAFVSCDDSSGQTGKVGRVEVVYGAGQCAIPGNEFKHEVRVKVCCATDEESAPGRKLPPLSGEHVIFEAADGSDLKFDHQEGTTDIVGEASVTVTAGRKIGDNYIKVIPQSAPDKFLLVRMIVGAEIANVDREGSTNAVMDEPIVVKVVDADGKPVEKAPVYFSVNAPRGKSEPKVFTSETVTDENGLAQTFVRLGGTTGEYHFSIEVADPAHGIYIRSMDARQFGIDTFSVAMSMIGGIAFLIFGMLRLSRGLQNIAGEKMQQVLQFFSKNAFLGVLAGAFVTAVIQSSAATTIMVLGFINAGLLNLVQAIGIIFGANIGTTMTAQLISFNLSGLALPAIAIGFVLMTFTKKRNLQGWGNAVFGFGMLFFGMSMMSSQMSVLGTFPSFLKLFSMINCAPKTPDGFMPFLPILGAIGLGMVAVFLVSASAAVVGIILALSAAGLIDFYTAVPLLIGTNIGTTINACLASFTANRVAKQAALAHFLFNFFGAVLMVVLLYIPIGAHHTPFFLYVVNSITPGDAFAAIPQNLERHIAMAHTLFNVVTVLAIMPFLKSFSHLCETLIPGDKTKPVSTRTLEPLLLRTPAVAIEQSISEIRKMVELSWSMIDRAVNHHFRAAHVDEKEFEQLEADEQQVDKMQSDITNYLVQITRQRLSNPQSNLIPLLMHCTNDAERIADHTANIMRLTKRLSKVDTKLSDVAQDNLNSLWELLSSQADNVMLALSQKHSENENGIRNALEGEKKLNKLAHKYEKNIKAMMAEQAREQQQAANVASDAEANEREINELAKQYEQVHVERRNKGECAVDASVIFIEMLWELERIGDHLVNIAQRAPEMQKFYINI